MTGNVIVAIGVSVDVSVVVVLDTIVYLIIFDDVFVILVFLFCRYYMPVVLDLSFLQKILFFPMISFLMYYVYCFFLVVLVSIFVAFVVSLLF